MVRANRIIVRRSAAIGDSLCATVVADRLIDLGYEVIWQTHPSIHCVIRRHPRISAVTDLNCNPDINLDATYERDPLRRRKHFHQMFFEAAQRQVSHMGINLGAAVNCRPELRLSPVEKKIAQAKFAEYPRPWVFICPRSDFYNVRQVNDGIWQEACQMMAGSKFWIGKHPAPAGLVDLKIDGLDTLIVYLSAADLMVTVDTGPMHLAAAAGVPLVVVNQSSNPELHLNDQRDFITVSPELDCLGCMENVCPISKDQPPCQNVDPEKIALAAQRRLANDRIAALIAVYRPEAAVLNRCLEAVLPQVDEVVVCRDQAGTFPIGALQNPKIKYVVHRGNDLGYGRKAALAARYSSAGWLLFLNDDVYLNPNAVIFLLSAAEQRDGIVCGSLHYPDGKLYPVAKTRAMGARDMSFPDIGRNTPWLQRKVELEDCSGAAILVRRKAFYEAGAFDERYMLYCEDDDLCMKVRRAGWTIRWTPEDLGLHDGHKSTVNMPKRFEIMKASGELFHRTWGRYFEHNAHRIPGNFAYTQ